MTSLPPLCAFVDKCTERKSTHMGLPDLDSHRVGSWVWQQIQKGDPFSRASFPLPDGLGQSRSF